jgi:hypothetical protein
LELAQVIEVVSRDDKFEVVASYNDASECVLVSTEDENSAWSELERISGVFVQEDKIAKFRQLARGG